MALIASVAFEFMGALIIWPKEVSMQVKEVIIRGHSYHTFTLRQSHREQQDKQSTLDYIRPTDPHGSATASQRIPATEAINLM